MEGIFGSSVVVQVVAIATVVLLLLYFYYREAFTYWKKRGVPYLKPTFPFGNYGKLVSPNKNPVLMFSDFYKAFEGASYGGIFKFTTPMLIARDPEIIKTVLVRDFESFYSSGLKSNVKVEPLTGHLGFLSGPKWKSLRIKLTPTFTSGKMKMMFSTIVETGKELQKYLGVSADNNEDIDVKEILARFSTDVIASCAFGIECNCLKDPNAEFRSWGKKVFETTFSTRIARMITFVAPFLIDYVRLSMIPKDVSIYFRKMVKDTIEYREKNNIQRNDFMQLLIQLKNKTLGVAEEDPLLKVPDMSSSDLNSKEPFEITMDVIAAQAFVFYAAGFETSSTIMTFCLYELALNPDIQSRLREEIDAAFREPNAEITYEAINEMEYLEKVINETLRKYPPATAVMRECMKTTRLQGTDLVVEKGTQVLVSVYGLHHDPKYFPRPEKFDPERFNEEEIKKRPNFSYLPFGEGPRICIGMRFGLMQIKVGLITILRNYEVQVSEKTPIPLIFDPKSFVLTSKTGMWLKIKRRDT